jgi:hypothetical protein
VSFADWSSKERLVGAAWLGVAVVCGVYALISDIPLFSSEFFSFLAIIALLLGLASTPSFMFKPLRQSLGEQMERSLKIGFGFFCAFQLIAILKKIL